MEMTDTDKEQFLLDQLRSLIQAEVDTQR